MKRLSACAAGLLLIGLSAFSFTHQASGQSGDGWISLFDGKTMDGWTTVGEANWRVEDGALVADKRTSKGAAHLVTKNPYKDFMLRVEFWASDDANSGIFMRCRIRKNIGDKTCYEANIFDQRKDPTYGTGGIVHFAEVNPMPKAGGKWNTFEITAKGRQITVDAQRPEDRGAAQRPVRRGTDHAAIRRRRHQVPQGADQAALTVSMRSPVRPLRGRTGLRATAWFAIVCLQS